MGRTWSTAFTLTLGLLVTNVSQGWQGSPATYRAENLGISFELYRYGDGTIGARLTVDADAGSPATRVRVGATNYRLERGDIILKLDDQPIKVAGDVLAHFAGTTIDFVNGRTNTRLVGKVVLPAQKNPPPGVDPRPNVHAVPAQGRASTDSGRASGHRARRVESRGSEVSGASFFGISRTLRLGLRLRRVGRQPRSRDLPAISSGIDSFDAESAPTANLLGTVPATSRRSDRRNARRSGIR